MKAKMFQNQTVNSCFASILIIIPEAKGVGGPRLPDWAPIQVRQSPIPCISGSVGYKYGIE